MWNPAVCFPKIFASFVSATAQKLLQLRRRLGFKVLPHQNLYSRSVRKEKLGDRITALHQLVSPFGKAQGNTSCLFSEDPGQVYHLGSLPTFKTMLTLLKPHFNIRDTDYCLLYLSWDMQSSNGSGKNKSGTQEQASCVVVSIEGEREEGDGGAELERDGDACHRYAGRGTGNPFFPGDEEPDDCCRRRSYRPVRDPGRSNRPGAWHFGDLGPSSLLLLCYSSSIFLLNVLLCVGVQTPNCIRQTVFDAVALDYHHVTVIEDATAAATPQIHHEPYRMTPGSLVVQTSQRLHATWYSRPLPAPDAAALGFPPVV
ncbi:hypothetical protein BHE74_00001204 [Ensete ventricosum]|nr:hypothetical protein BHE74_00001204 [Ensete ventricosum]